MSVILSSPTNGEDRLCFFFVQRHSSTARIKITPKTPPSTPPINPPFEFPDGLEPGTGAGVLPVGVGVLEVRSAVELAEGSVGKGMLVEISGLSVSLGGGGGGGDSEEIGLSGESGLSATGQYDGGPHGSDLQHPSKSKHI